MNISTTTKSQTPNIFQSHSFTHQNSPHQPVKPNHIHSFSHSYQNYPYNTAFHSQSYIQQKNPSIQSSPKQNKSFFLPVLPNNQDSNIYGKKLANEQYKAIKTNQNKTEFYEQVTYKIAPAEEDKLALDVKTKDGEDAEDEKGNLILYDYHGGPNQNFYLKKVGENQFYCKYNIINAATGFTLQVPEDSHDSIQLHMDPRNNGKSEIWELIPYPGGLFKIRSFCGKVLHADSTFLRNGTKVIQEVQKKERKQLWKIIPC